MLKGLPIGLVLGAILAFALLRAVEARRDPGAEKPAAGGASPAAVSPESEALKLELAGLKGAKSGLEGELAGLDGKLTAAKNERTSHAASPVAGKKFTNPWSPMAQRLFRLKDKLDDAESENSEEFRDLMIQFMEIAKELMEEGGFDMSDFEHSPYGSPMLMLAVLEGAEPPVDSAVMDKARAAVEKAEEEWKKTEARKGEISSLERQRDEVASMWRAMSGIKEGLTPEQRDWFKTGRMWSEESVRIDNRTLSGSREDIQAQLLAEITGELKLGAGGVAPIRPIAADFLRSYEAMEAAFAAREAAGETVSNAEKSLGRADLAIAVQAKIRGTVSLTEEQQKALMGMSQAWQVAITPEGK